MYQYRIENHPRWQTELVFTLEASEVGTFVDFLKEVLSKKRRSRQTLTERDHRGVKETWILFWEVWSGESRCNLAHPDALEWVAHIALQRPHLEEMIRSLEKQESFGIEEKGSLLRLGNFHVRFEI